jgi:hypothetical protein
MASIAFAGNYAGTVIAMPASGLLAAAFGWESGKISSFCQCVATRKLKYFFYLRSILRFWSNRLCVARSLDDCCPEKS